MFFSVLLFVKAFYPIKMPKQEKKKKNFYSFRVEMRISPGKPNGKKKTKTKKHFLEVSTTISVQYPVKIRLLLVKRNSGE